MFYDGFECNSACFNDFMKLIHVMCVTRKKSQLVFTSDTLSSAPTDTQSDNPSGTLSGTLFCTKIMGDLVVIISAANDGRIRDMGFLRVHGLQLLIF
jgi:hypothetical protein